MPIINTTVDDKPFYIGVRDADDAASLDVTANFSWSVRSFDRSQVEHRLRIDYVERLERVAKQMALLRHLVDNRPDDDAGDVVSEAIGDLARELADDTAYLRNSEPFNCLVADLVKASGDEPAMLLVDGDLVNQWDWNATSPSVISSRHRDGRARDMILLVLSALAGERRRLALAKEAREADVTDGFAMLFGAIGAQLERADASEVEAALTPLLELLDDAGMMLVQTTCDVVRGLAARPKSARKPRSSRAVARG